MGECAFSSVYCLVQICEINEPAAVFHGIPSRVIYYHNVRIISLLLAVHASSAMHTLFRTEVQNF